MSKETLEKLSFGFLPEGEEAFVYILKNKHGAIAKATTYGAALTELHVPNSSGELANIVLGFDNLAGYLKHKAHFGATIGRVANRIAAGQFMLDGKRYQLEPNDDRNNSIHGGKAGFDRKLWNVETKKTANSSSVIFKLLSPHLDEGFPGKASVTITYTLTDENNLVIDYQATTDQTTIINLTNHSYFNLDGAGSGNILNHKLRIAADAYTPIDENLIPTGELSSVQDTALDFRQLKSIGAEIEKIPAYLGGYDHNFVLRSSKARRAPFNELSPKQESSLKHEASFKTEALLKKDSTAQIEVISETSGRRMQVTTTQPGLQLYCGNFLDGTDIGNGGAYHRYYGFCLETQAFPNAINQHNFPSVILRPGEIYAHQTVFNFNP